MPSRASRALRTIGRVLLLAVTASLVSCIDSQEEYWLAGDGSGLVEITYDLPAAVAPLYGGAAGIRELINGFLAGAPDLTSTHCDVTTSADRLRVQVRAAFASPLTLKRLASAQSLRRLPAAAAHLAGDVTLNLQGRTLEVSRTISPGLAMPAAAWLAPGQFAGHRLVFILHLPNPATDSNATRVADDGRTLVWEIPLRQALASPRVTRFTTQLPIPWSLVTVLAVPLTLVGGFACFRWRKARLPSDARPPQVSPPL